MMDFDEITRILEMMREHELSEFELERDNVKLRIKKRGDGHGVVVSPPPVPGPMTPPASPASGGEAAVAPLAAAGEDLEFAIVKSPIVGTFYSASEPGAKPYASVGDTVQRGQILCIIEAMKLMNEIHAEIGGEIVKVYVENSHAVQYGERLFAIKPA
jgi:acetyl-CoA carboxylase biotin carboxyl carrier protein